MKWPDSQKLGEYVSQWTPGTPLFEDENFYISRVKPKARFRNANTQINEDLTEETDKKLVFWVPVGTASGVTPMPVLTVSSIPKYSVCGHTLHTMATGPRRKVGYPVALPMSLTRTV